MIARNNHRGTDRILKGEASIRHFIDRVHFVQKRVPLLWDSSKRNRRVEVKYWIPCKNYVERSIW